jgi:uncharacterized membrane protein YdjX (TVP38/TMEM64 family)
MEARSDERPWWKRLAESRGIQLSVTVVAVAALLAFWLAGDGEADRIARQLGGPGAAVLVLAQALIAVSPFPSQIVAVPVAVMYGFWRGVVLIWTGWMLAAVLQYWLSRKTADDIDLNAWLERTPRWIRRFPAGHPLFLILARQLPIGPHIVNISAGVLRVPLWRHLWCAAIAVVPEAVLVSGISVGIFR